MVLRASVGSTGPGAAGLDIGGILGQYQQQYAAALASNKARYEAVSAGYDARTAQAVAGAAAYGQNELADVAEAGIQDRYATQQRTARQGLSNFTIAGQDQGGAAKRLARNTERVKNDIATHQSDVYLNASGQALGFQGSYHDPYPDSGFALGAAGLSERAREFNASQNKTYIGSGGGGGSGSGGSHGANHASTGAWGQMLAPPNNTYGHDPNAGVGAIGGSYGGTLPDGSQRGGGGVYDFSNDNLDAGPQVVRGLWPGGYGSVEMPGQGSGENYPVGEGG